jgi:ribosomal-protein-alanine N-acetyltransferase
VTATSHIRPCTRADLTSVHHLEIACFHEDGALPLFAIVQYYDLFADSFFVVVEGTRCIGFVILGRSSAESDVGWLLDIAVAESHQKRGLASELIGAALPRLKTTGVAQVRATVAPANAASLALLSRLGFAIEREDPAYFGPGESRLLLRLTLH